MIIQDNEPMHVRVPHPPWAMNPSEVGENPTTNVSTSTADDEDDDDIATW